MTTWWLRRTWKRQVPLRTCTIAIARRPLTRQVHIRHVYHNIPRRPWTTTSTTTSVPLLPSTNLIRSEKACFEGTTPRRHPRTNACVLYEMLVFAPCPSCHCTFLLVCHAIDPWEPVNRDYPTILAWTVHPHFLLHRHLDELSDHRNVAVAPFSLSLLWHPFRSTTVTKAS